MTTHSGMPPERVVGAYRDTGTDVFAIARFEPPGMNDILAGDGSSIFRFDDPMLMSQVGPVDMTGGFASGIEAPVVETGMFPAPESGVSQTDVFVISRGAAYRTFGSDSGTALQLSAGSAFRTSDCGPGDRTARAAGARLPKYALETCPASPYVVLTTGDVGTTMSAYVLARGTATRTGSDLTDLALDDLDNNGAVDLVTIEAGTLMVYQNIALNFTNANDSTPASILTTPLEAGYDLLSVNAFAGFNANDEILVFASGQPGGTPRCYALGSGSAGSGSGSAGSGSAGSNTALVPCP
jgi:hypothetical protein